MKDILTFTTPEHRFLSNFYPYKNKSGDRYPYSVHVVYDGIEFDCVENAYQAAKLTRRFDRVFFTRATPYAAKLAMDSGAFSIRSDWDDVKLSIMENLVFQKFNNSPQLAQMLIDTGDAKLVEGNDWGDVFWGVCNGVGCNHLGRILMDVRRRLK